MARKSNLIQRKGRWYYNRAFPKDLWPITGKAPFRLSLRTDSLEQAQRRRADAERRYWAAVDTAKAKLGETKPRELTEVEAVGLVARWLKDTREFIDETRRQRFNPEQLAGALGDLDEALAAYREQLGTGDYADAEKPARELLERERLTVDPDSSAYRKLVQLLIRAKVELTKQERARLLGDFSYQPGDPEIAALFAPHANQPAPATQAMGPKRTIGDLIDAYKADKEPGWSLATQRSYEPVWRLLKDVLGEQRAVSSLTREDGRNLFETVKALPRNMAKVKQLQGLTVPQAVAKGRELGLPTLAPKSINDTYLSFLKSIFRFAVAEQWLSANPMEGLSVKDDVDAADKRDPFTTEQLKTIFSGGPWKPRDEAPRGNPLLYWGPLLALFHGLRRGEIAQLDLADISKVDGYDVILVRAGGRKRLKTKNARRMLPVHPELIRMGFLAYVQRQRDGGETQLFPGEAPNTNGQWGDGLSDWFSRLVKAHKLVGARLGMHSFRHGWQDRARASGIHGTAIGAVLAGRSSGGGRAVEDSYGSGGFPTEQLAEAVASITYPGLDLSHLYVGGDAIERPALAA